MNISTRLSAPRPRLGPEGISPFVRRSLRKIEGAPQNLGFALDVPSGHGRHSFFLAESGYRVVSMDIDECALRGALRATKPSSRIHFVVADFDVGLPILE